MKFCLMLYFLVFTNLVFGQLTKKIKVVDMETGMAIPDVTIRRGEFKKYTDKYGLCVMPDESTDDSISFSHINYEYTKIVIADLSITNVVKLRQKSTLLEEALVQTGYQKISPRLSTGAVNKIAMSDLEDIYGNNILQKLEGNSPIVFDKSSGRPATTLRGLSSINNSSLPLIVMDNFPFEGDIGLINPEDIADITILKDAAASAIWGTRAGNGVIVITTKKGKYNSSTKITLSGGIQIQERPDLYYLNQISSSAVVDLEKFLFEKGYYNSQERSTLKPWLSPVVENLIAIRDGVGDQANHNAAIETLRGLDVREDYGKYIYQTGVNQNYNLSFEGGSSIMRYVLSGRFDNNTGTLGEKDKKMVLRSFTDLNILPNLRLTTDLQYYNVDEIGGRNAYSLIGTRPYMMLADNTGNPMAHAKYREGYLDTVGSGRLLDWFSYPLTSHKDQDLKRTNNVITVNLGMEYKLKNIVTLQANYRYEHTNAENNNLYGKESYTARDLINRYSSINYGTGKVSYGVPMGGILDQQRSVSSGHYFRLGSELQKSWRDFHITALLGIEWRQLETENSENRLYGFDPDNFSNAKVDYINPYKNLISRSTVYVPFIDRKSKLNNRFVSQYMNASFSFKQKHVLTGSIRRDASNLFGVKTNDKWQPLWSLGYRWNVSSEEFLKTDWLSSLSLRLSYGINGNVDQSRTAITTIKYGGPDIFTNNVIAYISQYANPELRWEKNKIANMGIDFALFKGKMGGSVDFYSKKGEDLFGIAPIDYTAVPNKGIMRNVASMVGKGIDINLYANVGLGNNVFFKPQFMLNTNHSKITDYYLSGTTASEYLSNGSSVSGQVGYPVYAIFSYRWRGLDAAGNPKGLLDGKESTDYAGIRSQNKSTLEYDGSAVPTYSGFLNPVFVIGRFEVLTGFSFKFGHVYKRSSVRYGELVSMGALGAGSGEFERRWQKPGDEHMTSVPSFIYPLISYRNQFYENSSILVEPADHVRLQNITLSYRFLLAGKINAKVNINGTNLGVVWKKSKVDFDPDYTAQLKPEKMISIGIRLNY